VKIRGLFPFVFMLLQWVFVSGTSGYLPMAIAQNISSCCVIEENGCCGNCEIPSSLDNCCHGGGCCGWQETRVSTVYSYSIEEEVKVDRKANFSLPIFKLRIPFAHNYNTEENKPRVDTENVSVHIENVHAFFSIWRC